MKNTIFRNPGLKVVSLLVAYVVWFLIMNVSNPVTVRTIANVPVNISKASYIESQNLSYRIADGFDTISVTVRGNRRVVERLNAGSFNVGADLTQIVDMTSNPVMVPVTASPVPGISLESIDTYPQNIQIVLEDMDSGDFLLNASVGGTSPARGYEVGKMSTNPERLTIRGPKSLIERIDRVQAEVDVTGLDSDTSLTPTILIYDKNGDVLTENRMKYLTTNISENSIRVKVQLLAVVTDIPIAAETYGTPLEGYQVGDISVTPQVISLAGTEKALEAFRNNGQILINEASKAVDISGASEDVEIQVNLPDYLGDGIRIAEGFSDTVLVRVKILKVNTRSVEIQTKEITRNGIGEDLNAVFEEGFIDVRVQGSDEALESLTAEMIKASVDLKDLKTGEATVPVTITLPEGLSLAEPVETKVTITKTETQPAPEADEVAIPAGNE